MKIKTLVTSFAAVAAMTLAGGVTDASAESTLEIIKKRGHLRCQVGQPSPGFYNLDAQGNWYGSDVSICQGCCRRYFWRQVKTRNSVCNLGKTLHRPCCR